MLEKKIKFNSFLRFLSIKFAVIKTRASCSLETELLSSLKNSRFVNFIAVISIFLITLKSLVYLVYIFSRFSTLFFVLFYASKRKYRIISIITSRFEVTVILLALFFAIGEKREKRSFLSTYETRLFVFLRSQLSFSNDKLRWAKLC